MTRDDMVFVSETDQALMEARRWYRLVLPQLQDQVIKLLTTPTDDHALQIVQNLAMLKLQELAIEYESETAP